MPFIVVKSDVCPTSKPYGVFTETQHGSGKTKGSPHGCHSSRKAALRQAAALYVNVPEANSEAPAPPNLRNAAEGSTRCCETCQMFDDGICWGYGNAQVEADQVCDSYSPEPEVSREEQMTGTAAPPAPLASHTHEWRARRAKTLSNDERKRSERRQVAVPLELREEVRQTDTETGEQTGIRTLRSYASLFDTPYNIGSSGYRYEEQVKRGAFKRSLGRSPDVVFRYDHSGPPLARSSSGTLRLGEDDRGLWYEADLNTADPDVQALIPKIERKDLTESSFAFRCIKDDWNDDFTTRALEECELDRGDVSVVTFGASRATGYHMLLRSEELEAIQDQGFERFLEAWTEWRDFTLLPVERRIGKMISNQSMETLRKVLNLFATADDAVDEGQALLSDLMGVPNPNGSGDYEGEEDDDLTSSEQLDHVRNEDRAATDEDRARSAPHLLDSVLVDLGHLHRHVERIGSVEVQGDTESLTFNQDHAMRHVLSAQDHAQRLGEHLEEHPSDPQVFRTEREKLTSMRDEAAAEKAEDATATAEDERSDGEDSGETPETTGERSEENVVPSTPEQLEEALAAMKRDAPTVEDWGIMSALQEAKLVLAYVKGKQLADPDHETDPDDMAVMGCINDAEAAVDAAIVCQAQDGRYDEEDDGERSAEEEDVAAAMSDVIAAKSALCDVIVAGDPDGERHDEEAWALLENAERSLQRAIADQATNGAASRQEGDEPGDDEDEYWLRSQRDVPKEYRVDLSTKGRLAMADAGTAMSDGSYPIPNVQFLKKAIRAFGRAKDKPAVKTWIKRRAKALGATSLLPESWRAEPLATPEALPGNDSEELLFDLQALNFRR